MTYWDSPLNTVELDVDAIENAITLLDETLGYEIVTDLREMKIICMPGVIARTAGQVEESAVLFSDYLLISNEDLEAARAIITSIIPQNQDAYELWSLVIMHLLYGEEDGCLYNYTAASAADSLEKPDYESLLLMKEEHFSELEEAESVESDYDQLFHYQCSRLSYAEVMQACKEYLTNTSEYEEDQLDFLYNLN